jgi:uncharacterized membrane protein
MVHWLARHWLAVFSVALFLYIAVPTSAPILMQLGATGPARVIYALYRGLCHELPERSYFLFGPQATYSLTQLEADNVLPGGTVLQRPQYLGDHDHGYKIALCQRDLAIYGSMLVVGLLYGVMRRRRPIKPIKLTVFALFLIPIAVDGLSQLPGWRESNWVLRTVTGTLFGIGLVWLAYPHVQAAMNDVATGVETAPVELDKIA